MSKSLPAALKKSTSSRSELYSKVNPPFPSNITISTATTVVVGLVDKELGIGDQRDIVSGGGAILDSATAIAGDDTGPGGADGQGNNGGRKLHGCCDGMMLCTAGRNNMRSEGSISDKTRLARY